MSFLIRILLLFCVTVFALEPALGEALDGAVHHETAGVASTHARFESGDHGHEDEGLSHEHGSGHRHGTVQDHCVHFHAVDLMAPAGLPLLDERSEPGSISILWLFANASIPPPGQPPRA